MALHAAGRVGCRAAGAEPGQEGGGAMKTLLLPARTVEFEAIMQAIERFNSAGLNSFRPNAGRLSGSYSEGSAQNGLRSRMDSEVTRTSPSAHAVARHLLPRVSFDRSPDAVEIALAISHCFVPIEVGWP